MPTLNIVMKNCTIPEYWRKESCDILNVVTKNRPVSMLVVDSCHEEPYNTLNEAVKSHATH